MMSVGTRAFLLNEARTGPRMFACPKCTAKVGESCRRAKGYRHVGTHGERRALWDQYCREAPTQLAWLQQMALPWFELAIEDYLRDGKRPRRRKVDIDIAARRIDEARLVLSGAPA